jgi:hypothetical protein
MTKRERNYLRSLMQDMLQRDSSSHGAVNAICDVLNKRRRFPGVEADHATLAKALSDEARRIARDRGIPPPADFQDGAWIKRIAAIIREHWPESWAACNAVSEFDLVRLYGPR